MSRPTERQTLHFALAYLPDDRDATLHVGLRRYPLRRHTAQSLDAARRHNLALAALPDGVVSHYVEDVELPSDMAQLLFVTEPPRRQGATLPSILLTKLHIPRAALIADAERRFAAGINAPHPTILALGGTDDGLQPDLPVDVGSSMASAMDAAVQCVSQHLELINVGATTAATVTAIITSAAGISDLKNAIHNQAVAYARDPTQLNWVNETPYLNPDGSPSSTMSYAWSPETLEWMTAPMQAALQTTKDTPSLQSTGDVAGLYTVQSGVTTVASSQGSNPSAPAGPHVVVEAAQDDGPAWTVNDLTPKNGFTYNNDLQVSGGTFSASFTNSWLRWLSGYVEFLGPDGSAVEPEGWTSQVPGDVPYIDSDTQKYVAMYSSVDTILSIPVTATPTEISFPWPSNASGVRILAGGLGRSGGIEGQNGDYYGGWDTQVCTVGAVMTSVFDFAVPVIMLSFGATISESALSDLAKSCIAPVLDITSAIINGPLAAGLSGGDTTTILVAFADSIPHLLLDSPDLVAALAAAFSKEAVEESTPIFGWIAMAVGVVTTLSDLAQTTAEVASSPATFEVVATAATDATWTLSCDPEHGMWPLEATTFSVTATFTDGTTRVTTGPAPPQNSDAPLTVTFDAANANQLPAGGTVVFTAAFFSDTGWLCATAASPSIAVSITESLLTVPPQAITENLVPLSSSTQYLYDNTLVYDATTGGRTWSSSDRPTATIGALDPTNDGGAIGALGQITVNEPTNELGYGWQASGQDIPVGGAATNAQTYVFQTVGIVDPTDSVAFVPSGFVAGAPVAFGLQEPVNGNNFYIDPTDEEYQLRQLVLDESGTITFPVNESFGRFNEQIDAFVVHPAGYAVGVNTDNRKLEVLALPAAPVADADAPLAELYAGYGSRAGLLYAPVGVAPAVGSGVIVLQSTDANPALQYGEAQLQAFDLLGNPAPIFVGGASTVALYAESAPVTGLAIATESQGYIYVLKYLNTGSAVQDYLLDLYAPDGSFLSQTIGLPAGSIAVDLWRTLYTLDFEQMTKPAGQRPEPTVSEWTPTTPS